MTVENILKEINEEVIRAAAMWSELDRINTTNDYIAYAISYIGRAATNCGRNERDGYDSSADRRKMLIKAAGLLVRAAEKEEGQTPEYA